MCNILEVADAAEVIVNGYAFTKAGESVKNIKCVGIIYIIPHTV